MLPSPDAERCPDCGTLIGPDPAVAGLCPQCLLSLALHEPEGAPDEAQTMAPLAQGRILGERYQIRELLGRGGMGEVFRAFDLKLRVDVALKAVRADRADGERAHELLRQEVRDYYAHFRVTPDLIELRNLVEVADLIVRSALSRKESRGLHFTLDHPETLADARDTILVP